MESRAETPQRNIPTLSQAEDTAFWLALCPAMTIQGEAPVPLASLSSLGVDQEGWSQRLTRLHEEGYMKLEPWLSKEEAAQLAATVQQVEASLGIPVFALVYDAFWQLIPRLAGLLEEVLEGSFRVLPDIWVWLLHPEKQDKGWGIHRDRNRHTLTPEGKPRTLSLWIALTDATTDNGCIHVLPAFADPDYTEAKADYTFSLKTLQAVRALPVKAGSVLCWTQHLVHWGGQASRFATHPRISVAFELQRSDLPAFSNPLMPAETMPSFPMRLGLIARQILQYQHMITVPPELLVLAKKLHRHLPKERSFAGVLERLMGPKKKRRSR